MHCTAHRISDKPKARKNGGVWEAARSACFWPWCAPSPYSPPPPPWRGEVEEAVLVKLSHHSNAKWPVVLVVIAQFLPYRKEPTFTKEPGVFVYLYTPQPEGGWSASLCKAVMKGSCINPPIHKSRQKKHDASSSPPSSQMW